MIWYLNACVDGSRTKPHSDKTPSDKTPLTNTHFGHNPTLKLMFNKYCFIGPSMLLID